MTSLMSRRPSLVVFIQGLPPHAHTHTPPHVLTKSELQDLLTEIKGQSVVMPGGRDLWVLFSFLGKTYGLWKFPG